MKYRISRTWRYADTVEVIAATIQEAIELAYKTPIGYGEFVGYVDDSLIIHDDYYEEGPEDDTPSP